MDTYVKKIRIVPTLDLSNFKKELSDIPQRFSEVISGMKEKSKELGNTLKTALTSFKNESKLPSINNTIAKDSLDSLSNQLEKSFNVNIVKNQIEKIKEKLNNIKLDITPKIKDFSLGISSSLQEKLFGGTFIKTQIKEIESELNRIELKKQDLKEKESKLGSTDSEKQLLELYKNNENIIKTYQQEIDNLKSQMKTSSPEEKVTLKEKIEEFQIKQETTFGENTELAKNTQVIQEYIEIQEESNELQEEANDLQKEKKKLQTEGSPKLDLKELGSKIGDLIGQKLNKLIDSLLSGIKNFFKSAIDELKNMASYSLSTTLTVDTAIRDQALMYGLSEAQNYAFDRVKEEMKISGIEDLGLLTPAQQERFSERIGYYSGKYEELANKDFFRKYEEYTASMNDFKEELRMSIIQFIVDNKDTIMQVMNFLMEALKSIMNTINKISNFLNVKPTESQTSGTISDIINNYSTSSKVANVKVDNSFNGISLKDQNDITEAINLSNEQLIQALNGNLGY